MQNVSALPVAGLREKPARLVGFMIRRTKEIISFVMGLAVPALPKDFVREHGAWKKKLALRSTVLHHASVSLPCSTPI